MWFCTDKWAWRWKRLTSDQEHWWFSMRAYVEGCCSLINAIFQFELLANQIQELNHAMSDTIFAYLYPSPMSVSLYILKVSSHFQWTDNILSCITYQHAMQNFKNALDLCKAVQQYLCTKPCILFSDFEFEKRNSSQTDPNAYMLNYSLNELYIWPFSFIFSPLRSIYSITSVFTVFTS